ncbi:hypothetical protein ZIOFF_028222 [Zingiber officinale]|uniref:HAT C-terminal dimerisation domain-containing protein n=1 Tax=Zingiber officinale TaxID=94328 RepID=A0A8J5GMS1_ZINOF|nr:hypothetical protein ZIOFF_028222 [Zingiber officinale]
MRTTYSNKKNPKLLSTPNSLFSSQRDLSSSRLSPVPPLPVLSAARPRSSLLTIALSCSPTLSASLLRSPPLSVAYRCSQELATARSSPSVFRNSPPVLRSSPLMLRSSPLMLRSSLPVLAAARRCSAGARRCSQKPAAAQQQPVAARKSPPLLTEARRCSVAARHRPLSVSVHRRQENVDDYSPLRKFVTKVERQLEEEMSLGHAIYVKEEFLTERSSVAFVICIIKYGFKILILFSGILQNDDPTKKRKGPLGPLEKTFNLNARDKLHSEIARYYSHEWLQESPNCLSHRDIEVSRERKRCIERYYSNSSERISVNEFASLSAAIDDFSDNDSMCDRGLMSPTKWWVIHGASTPTLQNLALKLLGHLSSSCCERNWSIYNHTLIEEEQDNTTKSGRFGKMWDVGANGFDSMGIEGATILEIASFDEPELESVLVIDEDGVGDEIWIKELNYSEPLECGILKNRLIDAAVAMLPNGAIDWRSILYPWTIFDNDTFRQFFHNRSTLNTCKVSEQILKGLIMVNNI